MGSALCSCCVRYSLRHDVGAVTCIRVAGNCTAAGVLVGTGHESVPDAQDAGRIHLFSPFLSHLGEHLMMFDLVTQIAIRTPKTVWPMLPRGHMILQNMHRAVPCQSLWGSPPDPGGVGGPGSAGGMAPLWAPHAWARLWHKRRGTLQSSSTHPFLLPENQGSHVFLQYVRENTNINTWNRYNSPENNLQLSRNTKQSLDSSSAFRSVKAIPRWDAYISIKKKNLKSPRVL